MKLLGHISLWACKFPQDVSPGERLLGPEVIQTQFPYGLRESSQHGCQVHIPTGSANVSHLPTSLPHQQLA